MEFHSTLTVRQLQKIKAAFKASKNVQIQLNYEQLTKRGGFNAPGAEGAGPNKILLTSEQQEKIEKCLVDGKNRISKNQRPNGIKIFLSPDASGGVIGPLWPGGLMQTVLQVAASLGEKALSTIENEATSTLNTVPILGTILEHQKAGRELAEIAKTAREAQSAQPLTTSKGETIDRKMLYHMFPADGAGVPAWELRPSDRVETAAGSTFSPLSTKDFIKEGIPVFMRDTIPADTADKTQYGVVNCDSINGKGTHWVCFFQHVDDGAVYYFDPYGDANPPKELVKAFEDHEIRYNKEQVQKMEEDHPICGHLCIAFLKMMENGQQAGEVLKFLKDDHLSIAKSILTAARPDR